MDSTSNIYEEFLSPEDPHFMEKNLATLRGLYGQISKDLSEIDRLLDLAGSKPTLSRPDFLSLYDTLRILETTLSQVIELHRSLCSVPKSKKEESALSEFGLLLNGIKDVFNGCLLPKFFDHQNSLFQKRSSLLGIEKLKLRNEDEQFSGELGSISDLAEELKTMELIANDVDMISNVLKEISNKYFNNFFRKIQKEARETYLMRQTCMNRNTNGRGTARLNARPKRNLAGLLCFLVLIGCFVVAALYLQTLAE